jgi:hypothetical protein
MVLMWTTTVTTPNRAIREMQPGTTQWVAAKPKFTKLLCLAMEVEQVVMGTAAKVAMGYITCDCGRGREYVYNENSFMFSNASLPLTPTPKQSTSTEHFAIMDSGATSNFFTTDANVINVKPATKPFQATLM